MLPTRSSAARLARRFPLRIQRRYESSHKPAEAHGSSHSTHHAVPHNESFGSGFYIMLGVAPVAYLFYSFSKNPDQKPSWLASWIPDSRAEWEKRNSLHTLAVEQAGRDKALFNSTQHSGHIELRFNEVFNTGSPINKHSSNSVNLEKVVEHYRKKNKETEEAVARKTPEQIFASGGEYVPPKQ